MRPALVPGGRRTSTTSPTCTPTPPSAGLRLSPSMDSGISFSSKTREKVQAVAAARGRSQQFHTNSPRSVRQIPRRLPFDDVCPCPFRPNFSPMSPLYTVCITFFLFLVTFSRTLILPTQWLLSNPLLLKILKPSRSLLFHLSAPPSNLCPCAIFSFTS